MTLLTQAIDLFVIVSIVTGFWYLGSAAGITHSLRKFFVRWALLHEWLVCPACCSVWYGAAFALVANWMDRPVLGLSLQAAVPVTAFVCMKWVPWMASQLVNDLANVTAQLNAHGEESDGEE